MTTGCNLFKLKVMELHQQGSFYFKKQQKVMSMLFQEHKLAPVGKLWVWVPSHYNPNKFFAQIVKDKIVNKDLNYDPSRITKKTTPFKNTQIHETSWVNSTKKQHL